jgi:hypothetical protein
MHGTVARNKLYCIFSLRWTQGLTHKKYVLGMYAQCTYVCKSGGAEGTLLIKKHYFGKDSSKKGGPLFGFSLSG